MTWSPTVHRSVLHSLIIFALAFGSDLAHAASSDGVRLEGFQKGEEFTVRKAMLVAYGNVDSQNKSRFKACTPEGADPPWMELYFDGKTLIATDWYSMQFEGKMFLVTSAVLVPSEEPPYEVPPYDCHNCAPLIGLFVFENINGRWVLSLSSKYLTMAGGWGVAPSGVDVVKIGDNQWAFVINDGDSGQGYNDGWINVYSPVSGTVRKVLNVTTGKDNSGTCSKKKEEQEGLIGECYSETTEVSIVPTDAKFYALKAVTFDDLAGKSDGHTKPVLKEQYFQFDENQGQYVQVESIHATGTALPLLDETTNYGKWHKASSNQADLGK